MSDDLFENLDQDNLEEFEEFDNIIEEELGVIFNVRNIDWLELVNMVPTNLEILTVRSPSQADAIIDNNILVLGDKVNTGFDTHIRPFIVPQETKIPYIENSQVSVFTATNRKIHEKGMLIKQVYNNDCGLVTFIPYNTGFKRITGFFKYAYDQDDPIYYKECYFYTISDKGTDIITNVSVPENEPRHIGELTDDDRFILSQTSAKFANQSRENWNRVEEVLHYLRGQLYDTVDPNYMFKIMNLSKNLCYRDI